MRREEVDTPFGILTQSRPPDKLLRFFRAPHLLWQLV